MLFAATVLLAGIFVTSSALAQERECSPWLTGNRDSCNVRLGIALGGGLLSIRQQAATYSADATRNGALDAHSLDGAALSSEWAQVFVFELWAPIVGVGPFYTAVLQRSVVEALERPASVTVQTDALVEFRRARHMSIAAVVGLGAEFHRFSMRSELALGYRYFGYDTVAYRGEQVATRGLQASSLQSEFRALLEVWPHQHFSVVLAAGVDPAPPLTISTSIVLAFHLSRFGALSSRPRRTP